MSLIRSFFFGAALLAAAPAHPAPLAAEFAREVDLRLQVPRPVRDEYAARLAAALEHVGLMPTAPQYYMLVDRSPRVQAAFVYWFGLDGTWQFVGASPVSTGKPGEFEHFRTPLGVFAHSLANRDFRAEGTRNALGVLGYGEKGMRIFDFGWVDAERGWDEGGMSPMRLQMHATDPSLLEPLLGAVAHSKGCIRIPASFNVFLDRHALLDADYEAAAAAGRKLAVLRDDRVPTLFPGRFLVVVDSERERRPSWARRPAP
jgi:hypothetical protein